MSTTPWEVEAAREWFKDARTFADAHTGPAREALRSAGAAAEVKLASIIKRHAPAWPPWMVVTRDPATWPEAADRPLLYESPSQVQSWAMLARVFRARCEAGIMLDFRWLPWPCEA